MNRIIYTTDNSTVVVVTPTEDFTAEFCIKDVPDKAYYKIVDVSDIPTDRHFRDAWEVTVDETWSIK